MPTGSEIRRKFLDFFVHKGHREVHSSSLVPANDPTLLFTNAGMNQFKDVFLGLEKRDYNKATTSQKCVRAGGKHNDLENVGFTNRHHTFFEMLGNFSFGDYFKRDAIAYAWELITSPQWFGIPKEKLYVTVFNGEGGVPRDAEAFDLWAAQGIPKERIFEMGLKDNFWQMGDTGPCGPCSEIHYDMGVAASEHGHTDCAFTCDCGRYVEIWNLVFMQFDREGVGERDPKTGLFPEYKLNPLPKPSIDTGMGLERLAAVLQGVISNYDTDLFTPLIVAATRLINRQIEETPETQGSLRIIADHARASTFLISDGVSPSNEGRGYVLRKIMRRAMRHARLLGGDFYVLSNMTRNVTALMAGGPHESNRSNYPYPELRETLPHVEKVIRSEEIRFEHTLRVGLEKLEDLIEQSIRTQRTHDAAVPFVPESKGWLSGKEAFKLYDTFGLPLDFMVDAARDRGLHFNQQEFDQSMLEQRQRAQASWKAISKQSASPVYGTLPSTTFEGYRQTRSDTCEVLAIIKNGQGAQDLKPGDEGEVILDHTPFYAESGGQVGDRGWFYSDDHNTIVAEVKGCYSPIQGVRAHQVIAKQPIRVGDKVDAVVNTDIRLATMRNHTATHLLQAGLREVLGKHVKQAGSLVAPNHLRFDFSHFTGVADEELQDIEDIINKEVLRNEKVQVIKDVPIDVAVNEYKAMALFGEKYGDRVRVIKIGDFSTELCGGTHTLATGEIGLIKILKEGSVSSGVRRVEAVTGETSVQHFRKDHKLEKVVRSLARTPEDMPLDTFLRDEIKLREEENERLRRELDQVRMKSASSSVGSVTDKIKEVHGVKVLAHRVDNLERAQMRTLVDQLRDKLGSGVVVLGSTSNGNVSLIVGVTKDLTSKVPAGKVIGPVAQKIGGKGGGRPDLAEAGGKDPGELDAALDEAYGVVEGLLRN